MNAGALVYCLLDAEGEYTPEGYKLVDTAHVGDYELRLWQGTGHREGEPLKFHEISLNAIGRTFDPESQHKKFPGSTAALGQRGEFLRVIAEWLKKSGDLYIGSHVPSKLAVYYRLFKRYLPQFQVSEPHAAFDECEGKPEYFHVTAPGGVIESILSEADDPDVNRYIDDLPSVMSRAVDAARKIYVAKVKSGEVNDDNFGEWAESIANEVVYKFQLATGDELVDTHTANTILYFILNRDRPYAE